MKQDSSKMPLSTIDQVKIKRKLIICLAFLGTVIASIFTLKSGNIFFMGGLLALPFALMLINRPDLAFLIGVILDATNITMAGINLLTLGVLMQLMVIASSLLSWFLIGRNTNTPSYFEKRPLVYFTLLIIFLMLVRGAGLRFFGSDTWGGMIYIRLFIAIFFFFAIHNITISKKHYRILIVGTVLAGIVGTVNSLFGFVADFSDATSAVGPISVGSMRLVWVIPFVYALFPVVITSNPKISLFKFLVWILLLGAISLTGFRSRLVLLLMVTFLFGYFINYKKIAYFIKCGFIAAALWIFLIFISPYVQGGMQRAISFLPGVKSDIMVTQDADNSVSWRVEIWKYCWERVPEYFWIGRGSAFNVYDAVENLSKSDIREFSPWFAYTTRSYHSGPLTLLLDYGFIGLVVGSWLLITIGMTNWKIAKNMAAYNSFESRYCLALSCWLIWEVFSFFAIYGQMPKFGRIIVAAAVVKVLAQSVEKMSESVDIEEYEAQYLEL